MQSSKYGEGDFYDCTLEIGPLVTLKEPPEWPMYSFDGPSTFVWNTIATNLYRRGWSDDKIKEWLQSKQPRWALDGDLGDALKALADQWATDNIK